MNKTQSAIAAIEWNSLMLWGFIGIHLVAITSVVLAIAGVIHPSASDWILCVVLYYARAFFIAAGYHRYFAHKSFAFRFPRVSQFILAFGATSSVQLGPLWWAGMHRTHHRYTDVPGDPHSPKLDGFFWSHMGWIMARRGRSAPSPILDFAKYPELRWIDRWHVLPGFVLAMLCLVFGGWTTLLIGFFLSTTLLYHGTFVVNSVAHVFGYRRKNTTDTSRNCPWLTPFVLGEQWHNNHHANQNSVRQGSRWWEIDPTYYVLLALQVFGITKNLKYGKAS